MAAVGVAAAADDPTSAPGPGRRAVCLDGKRTLYLTPDEEKVPGRSLTPGTCPTGTTVGTTPPGTGPTTTVPGATTTTTRLDAVRATPRFTG